VGSLLVAAVVVLFAMGPATPFFDWIAKLPALGWFRFPRRSLFMADFFIALALAVAWHVAAEVARAGGEGEASEKRELGHRRRLAPALCGLSALLVLALARPAESFVPLLGVSSALFAVAVAALVAWTGYFRGAGFGSLQWVSRVPIVLVGLLTLELVLSEVNRPLAWSAPTSLEKYHREREIYGPVQASSDRVWLRSLGIDPALPPKLATYFEMRSVGDYEPLNLRRQAEYFTYLMEGRLSPQREGRPYSGRLKHLTTPTYPGAIEARGHLLDVAAVRWFVMSKKAATRGELAGYVEAQGLAPVDVEDPHLVLLENPHAAPRAFVVYDVQAAPEPLELLRRMSDPAFDPLARSYVEGGEATSRQDVPDRGHAAEIVVDERALVEIAATLEAPGMLVLSDSYYPGWHATVAGREVEIHAVNHLFRGVELPAGSHVVRFEYLPKMLVLGAWGSVIALAAIALLARPSAGGVGRGRLRPAAAGDSIPGTQRGAEARAGREST
jgi:hypothetical protein